MGRTRRYGVRAGPRARRLSPLLGPGRGRPFRAGASDRPRPAPARRIPLGRSRGRAHESTPDPLGRDRMGGRFPDRPLRELDGWSDVDLQAAVEPSSVDGIVLTNSVFPWRFRAVPHPLVLAAFGVYATPRLGERVVSWRVRGMDPDQLVRLSLRALAADPRSILDDVVRLLVDLTRERRDDPDVARAFIDAARSMLRLGRRPQVSRRALEHVSCPVLLLHGRRDRLVPSAFAEAELARHPAWRGRSSAISDTSRRWRPPGGGSPRSPTGSRTRSTRCSRPRPSDPPRTPRRGRAPRCRGSGPSRR